MGEFQTEFNDFFDNAKGQWKEFDTESKAGLQKIEALKNVHEIQLASTSISEHVTFFDNQAKEHEASSLSTLNLRAGL